MILTLLRSSMSLRNIIIALILSFGLTSSFAWAQQQVQVFMQVGDQPSTPTLITSVEPGTEPVLVNLLGSRAINFTVNPNVTNNPLSWVVTVNENNGGIVGPASGTINTTTETRGYFDFLSPATTGGSQVTLRVFDSQSPTTPVFTRTISLYAF
jgi:hypothetical protein